jgi:hypothetical protein
MVSAVLTTATTIAITYNEAVNCPTAGANDPLAFAYDWTTGVSGGAVASGGCAGTGTTTLTLTGTAFTAPSTGASIVYTAGAGRATVVPDSAAVSVLATGTLADFAATQTLTGSQWAPPAITAVAVTATTVAITYNENVTCIAGSVTEAEFAYFSAGTTSGITTLTNAACATDVLTLTGTFTLPGTGASVVYTAPASPTITTAVYATTAYPQFAVTQTFAIPATATPAMASFVVPGGGGTTLTITYQEPVSCPATGADGDFVYDSAFNTLGGSITSCASGTSDTLVLSGLFNAATGAATLVYTAPAVSTTSNAVYAAGSTSAFAATQTLVG